MKTSSLMKTSHLKILKGWGKLAFLALCLSSLTASAALEFRRGNSNNANPHTRLWSDLNNWNSTRMSKDDAAWNTAASTIEVSSGTIPHEIYFGPYSSYNGNDAPGVNGNDGYVSFDVSSIKTYRWFVGYWGSTNPYYSNTALGIKATGDQVVTIDNSYNIGDKEGDIEKPVITTYYASNDFLFDISFEFMCIKNRFSTPKDVTNTIDLNSNYNTTFATGRTIEVTNTSNGAVTPAASAVTQLTFQAMCRTTETNARVYIGSQIITTSNVNVRAVNGTGADWGALSANHSAIFQFCGTVSNQMSTLGIWRKSRVELNMQNNATVVSYGGRIVFGLSNSLSFLGENQLSHASLQFNSDAITGTRGRHDINLNGNSVGVYNDGKGNEEWALNQFYVGFNAGKPDLDIYIDYGSNSKAQVFGARTFALSNSNLVDPTTMDFNIYIKNFVVGQDSFICGFELDSDWIGDQTTDGYIKFENYTVEDGYYITYTQIDDDQSFFYGAYEYTVTAIPEPSAFAAIFGVAVLVYVVRRRRS